MNNINNDLPVDQSGGEKLEKCDFDDIAGCYNHSGSAVFCDVKVYDIAAKLRHKLDLLKAQLQQKDSIKIVDEMHDLIDIIDVEEEGGAN